MKKTYLNKLFLVIVLILIASCIPYIYQSYTESHLVTTIPIECTEYINDSIINAYAEDMRRNKSYIFKYITENEKTLSDYLITQKSAVNLPDSFRMGVNISTNGKFNSIIFKNSFIKDSAFGKQLDTVLKQLKIDSISDYPISIGVIFSLMYKNQNNTYEIYKYDSIYYHQIRSKASIMRVVMHNLPHLRYAYNWRLRQRPGIKGKIGVKFKINCDGKVVDAKIIETTINDIKLENDVIKILESWNFCEINNKNDVTEVIYPFIFSQ